MGKYRKYTNSGIL